jgi:hypothetical protein
VDVAEILPAAVAKVTLEQHFAAANNDDALDVPERGNFQHRPIDLVAQCANHDRPPTGSRDALTNGMHAMLRGIVHTFSGTHHGHHPLRTRQLPVPVPVLALQGSVDSPSGCSPSARWRAPLSRTLFVGMRKACSTGTRCRPEVAALKQRVVLPAKGDMAGRGSRSPTIAAHRRRALRWRGVTTTPKAVAEIDRLR